MKKSREWIILLSICLILTGVLSYIIINKKTNTEVTYRIIYIPKVRDSENEFWTSVLEGAQMAAEQYQVDFQILAPDSENDYEEQKILVKKAIEEGPDAMILSPSSYKKITELALKAKEAGIRLVLIDSALDQKIEDTIVATDNYNAGIRMGTCLSDHIEKNPVIGVVSYVRDTSTAIERENGLKEGLGKYKDCIVNTVYCESNYDKAVEVTKKMLQEYPGMDTVFAMNEYASVGAARAIREMGMTDKITLIGFDSSVEEIRMLEEGVFNALVIQKPFAMGYQGVEKTIEILKGEKVSSQYDSGSELITKENIYTEENQKLLFPFQD